MSQYIIPVFIVVVLVYGFIKKTNVYSSFSSGAASGLALIISIMPHIASIFICVELIKASGLLDIIISICSPIFTSLGIPQELIALTILKPFSGAGSTALVSDIIATYGTSSYLTRVACVVAGSSETVFYISAIYFSKTNIKKLGVAIPIALFCTIFSTIIACLVCKIM